MVDASLPTEPQPIGKRHLPGALTKAAFHARWNRVDSKLYGPLSHPQALQESRQAVWSQRLQQVHPGGPFDPLISEMQRLMKGPERLDSFLDFRRGRVLLAERVSPSQSFPSLQLPSDLTLSRAQQIAQGDVQIATFIAKTLPESTVELLDRLQIRIEVGQSGTTVLPKHRERYGPAAEWVWKTQAPHPGALACYIYLAGLVRSRFPSDAPPSLVQSIILHELMHAVDWALGEPGQQFSSGPEWRQLFEAAHAKASTGPTSLPFPTCYSRTDPSEFFADCAATFFRTQVDQTGNVAVPEDLQRHLPEVEAMLDRLFSKSIPDLLQEGAPQKPTDILRTMAEEYQRYAERVSSDYPSLQDTWLEGATLQLQRFLETGDKADWEWAREFHERSLRAAEASESLTDRTRIIELENVLYPALEWKQRASNWDQLMAGPAAASAERAR